MDSALLEPRAKRPSIVTVYRPVEDYWTRFDPANDPGRDVERVLDPFDALLIHLVLDLMSGPPTVIDLASGSTAGASSVLGLNHPKVGRLVVIARGADRPVPALRRYVLARTDGLAPFEVVPAAEMPGRLGGREPVVILADARGENAIELAEEIRPWIDEHPAALALVLGLGRVGECPAIEALLGFCPVGSPRRFRLIRELGEMLAASHLGMISRADHPAADDVLLRLRLLYDGNFHFVDLLRSVHQSAMQASAVDDEVRKTHPSFRPLRDEMDSLKRSARESGQALAAMTADRDQLILGMEELSAISIDSNSFLAIVRRKLSLGILGRLYRGSKRLLGA
jgi:hypothetical protein